MVVEISKASYFLLPPLRFSSKSENESAAEFTRMGSAVSVCKGSDARGKSQSLVTQLRRENVRLQARVERLSVKGKRLNEEINTMLKEKEEKEEKLRVNCERFLKLSPTNADERGVSGGQEAVGEPGGFTEKVLQIELDELMKEKCDLKNEQKELKATVTHEDHTDFLLCQRKKKPMEQNNVL